MSPLEDITPEGSVAPVLFDPDAPEPEEPPRPNTAAQEALLASAMAKLQAIGLTEEEARVIAGLGPAAPPEPEE